MWLISTAWTVGQRKEHQLTAARHPDAEASEVRKLLQAIASTDDSLRHPSRGFVFSSAIWS